MGEVAQAEVVSDEKYDEDKMRAELRRFSADLQEQIVGVITELVSKRVRRWKKSNAALKEEAQRQRTVAEQRKSELAGQVARARIAEQQVRSLESKVRSVSLEVQAEKTELQEVIEEQASTIKAQAVALREAHRKSKG